MCELMLTVHTMQRPHSPGLLPETQGFCHALSFFLSFFLPFLLPSFLSCFLPSFLASFLPFRVHLGQLMLPSFLFMSTLDSLCLPACRCSTLQELRLGFCNISMKGAAALVDAIRPSPVKDKPALQPKLALLDLQVQQSLAPASAHRDVCLIHHCQYLQVVLQ